MCPTHACPSLHVGCAFKCVAYIYYFSISIRHLKKQIVYLKKFKIFWFFPTEKLSVDPKTVQHGVEGLMYLLTECSKLMVSLHFVVTVSVFLPRNIIKGVWHNY